MKIIFKRGAMLLQTLVMCIIMTMIGVMVLKWVMARYMLSSRLYRSAEAKARTEGCVAKVGAGLGTNFHSVPSGGSCTDPETNKVIKYKANPFTPNKFDFVIEQD